MTAVKNRKVARVWSSDEYTKIPFVTFYRIEQGLKKPVRINRPCFGSMASGDIPKAIRYVAPITRKTSWGKEVTDDAVSFYLAFMLRLIRQDGAPPFKVRKRKDEVHYLIETKGLHYTHMLFFLTWFRYVHHYPEMVYELFARKEEGDNDDALFAKFQRAHWEMSSGQITPTSRTHSDEALIFRYLGYNGVLDKPVPVAKLIQNIKYGSTNRIRVQSYIS